MGTVELIIASLIAIVIVVVAITYRSRLTSGKVVVRPDEFTAEMKADAKRTRNTNSTSRQQDSGRTIVDDNLLVNTDVSAPKNSDFKMRRNSSWKSNVTIRDTPSKEDEPKNE